MADSNNPASRLLRLLATGRQQDRGKPCKLAWAKVLDTPVDNLPPLLRRVGAVIEPPELIRERVYQVPDIDHEVYLKRLPKISTAFSVMNLEAQWASVIDQIDDTVVDMLGICSDALARRLPEKTLDENELKNILQETVTLRESVQQCDLPEDLRFFISDHLRMINDAIQECQIRAHCRSRARFAR